MVETEIEEREIQKEVIEEKTIDTTPVIDEAKKAAELMKIENDRKEKLLTREENLQAHKTLGGTSNAGQPSETTAEETPSDYAKKVLSGDLE